MPDRGSRSPVENSVSLIPSVSLVWLVWLCWTLLPPLVKAFSLPPVVVVVVAMPLSLGCDFAVSCACRFTSLCRLVVRASVGILSAAFFSCLARARAFLAHTIVRLSVCLVCFVWPHPARS